MNGIPSYSIYDHYDYFNDKSDLYKFKDSLPGIVSNKLSCKDALALAEDSEFWEQYEQLVEQVSKDVHNFVQKCQGFQDKQVSILDSYTPVLEFHKLLQLQHKLPEFLPLKDQEYLLKFPQYNQDNVTRIWSYVNLVNSEIVPLPLSEELELNQFYAEDYFRDNLYKRIEDRDRPFESFVNPDAPEYDQLKKTVAKGFKTLQERSIDWNTDQLEFDALQQIFGKQTEIQNQLFEMLKTICDVEENVTDSSFKIRDCKVEPPQDVGSSQYQLYALGLGILVSIGLYLKYRPFRRPNQEFLKQSIKLHWQTICAKKNEACDRLQKSAIAARNSVQA